LGCAAGNGSAAVKDRWKKVERVTSVRILDRLSLIAGSCGKRTR
jgi:hypothetical protein